MIKRLFVICCLLICQFTQAREIAASPNINNPQQLALFVDGVINGQLRSADIPGATISIVKDGNVLLSKGYGYTDLANNTPVSAEKSMFRIASISKTFVFTAVMQLYEQGLIDLDKDINSYLRDFKIPETFAQPITMRHIMTHSTGFEENNLGALILSNPDKVVSGRQELKQNIPRRVNSPGAHSAYSNYAVRLAGIIIENITGQNFSEYIEENIYQPLDMTHSTFPQPPAAEHIPYIMHSYQRVNGLMVDKGYEYVGDSAASGAMSSSASDMANYMLAHLAFGQFNNQQILQRKTAQLMQSRLMPFDKELPSTLYGFYQREVNQHRVIAHGGALRYSFSQILLDPQENLGIFVSFAKKASRQAPVDFIEVFYDYYYPTNKNEQSSSFNLASDIDRYRGNYKSWRSNTSTIEKFASSLNNITVKIRDENSLLVGNIPYIAIAKHRFKQLDGDGIALFSENQQGEIYNLRFSQSTVTSFSKVSWYASVRFNLVAVAIAVSLILTSLLGLAAYWRGFNQQPRLQKTARVNAAVTALLHLSFFAGLVFLLQLADSDSFERDGLPNNLWVILTLPLLALLATLGQLFFMRLSWQASLWGTIDKIHYSAVTLGSCFLIWFYYYWNFLGYNY